MLLHITVAKRAGKSAFLKGLGHRLGSLSVAIGVEIPTKLLPFPCLGAPQWL